MSATTSRLLRVFLCHAKEDKSTVRELYHHLNAEGWIDVWLDEERLFPGMDWNFEIERAVKAADTIIVCLSNKSVTKEGYIQRELSSTLNIALEKPEGTIFVIPLRLDNCDPPRKLRSWQYADYFPAQDRDRAYQRLLVSLRSRATRLGISISKPLEERSQKQRAKRPKPEKVVEQSVGMNDLSSQSNKVYQPEWKRNLKIIALLATILALIVFCIWLTWNISYYIGSTLR